MAEPLQLEAAALPGAGELAGLLGGDLAHIPELVRALLDATPARVIVIGADEHLAYANDGFFSFTRLHPKQVLGRQSPRSSAPKPTTAAPPCALRWTAAKPCAGKAGPAWPAWARTTCASTWCPASRCLARRAAARW